MKKVLACLLVLISVSAMVFAAATTEESSTVEAGKDYSKYIPSGDAPSEKIHLSIWVTYSGKALEIVTQAAEDFNASQSQFEAEVISSTNTLTPILSTTVEDRPSVFVTSTNNAGTMIATASDFFVPVQAFIEYDNYDSDNIWTGFKTLLARDGEWEAFPANNSSCGVYYNVTELTKNGINVDDISSLEDIYNVGLKLKAAGYETPIFFNTASVDWLNQFLCAEGVQYFNNNNGVDGTPTASLFGEGACHDATLAHFSILKKMAEAGLLASTELVPADRYGMFAKGDFLIAFNTGSNYATTKELVGDSFEFTYRPVGTISDSSKYMGAPVDGSCYFIGNTENAWEEYGAWLFIKHVISDKWAATLSAETGYVPVTQSAVKDPIYQEYINEKNPDMLYTIKALENTADGVGYAVIPFGSDYGICWKGIVKAMINTPEYTAEEALNNLVDGVKDLCEMYWLSQGVVL